MNIYDLISRAQKLRQETKLDSVSPDRVGALCEDTLKYINEFQLLASSPSLHKIYASVSAMQADKSPKSDLTGKALKPGQLVVIVPANQSDATAGDVYRYDGPSGNTSAWTFVSKIGAVPADAELNATSANPVQNKVVTEKLTELESSVIGLDFFSVKNSAVRNTGEVTASSIGVHSTDFLPITKEIPLVLIGGFTSPSVSIVPMAFYDADKNYISSITGSQDGFKVEVSQIPSNAHYIRCTTYIEYPKIALYGCSLGSIWDKVKGAFVSKGILPTNTNLNDIKENGAYLLTSDYKYENAPFSTAFLVVYVVDGFYLQTIYNYSGNLVKKRRGTSSGWEAWQDISINTSGFLTSAGSLDSVDLNTIGGNVTYLLDDSHTYENLPYEKALGFLRVTTPGSFSLQEFYPFSGAKLYKRRGEANGTWESWSVIAGGGSGSSTNNYTFPQYNNTYNIECSPQISVDTNNYLTSSNDLSDRTSDIVSMLNTTGVCHLGPGYFYINNLSMPKNSMLVGSGPATRVVLLDQGQYAIKLSQGCAVKDMRIFGNTDGISVNETVGDRHGILWQGNYTQTPNNDSQPSRCHIENLWIIGFTGGGITCYDTGYGTTTNMMAVNINIWNCTVGINVAYWSEFHKFTNVRCSGCYYGCINNGGNNIFNSCDFSSSLGIAFLMDNSNNQSPNNSHGSAVACVFNHTASNKGVGIKVLNNENGFVFSGCQIFYSQIEIDNSQGIIFTSCNFGSSNCDITVKGNGGVVFANNIFAGVPTITKTSTTYFNNCYTKGGSLISL